MNSQVLEMVVASGACGIKKAELKKIFGKDCEKSLDTLTKDDKIIVDNKGIAHYVWSKENYLSHLSEHDPKFKIISKIVRDLEASVNQLKRQATEEPTSNEADFKTVFDQTITGFSTSIGWVPFSQMRQKMCQSLQISQDRFYSLVSELIESNEGKYEVSTGGQEGINVRGLLHGYVRRL